MFFVLDINHRFTCGESKLSKMLQSSEICPWLSAMIPVSEGSAIFSQKSSYIQKTPQTKVESFPMTLFDPN